MEGWLSYIISFCSGSLSKSWDEDEHEDEGEGISPSLWPD